MIKVANRNTNNFSKLGPNTCSVIKGFRGKLNILLSVLRLQFKLLWYRPENLGIEKSVPPELRRCGNVYRHLDADFTQQLVNRCRQEKTTVQGALCAAMLFAAASQIRPEQKTRMSCRNYINLRKYLKPVIDHEQMGMVVSAVNSFHTPDKNTSFWDLAREVIQQLKVGLKGNDMFIEMLLFRKILEVSLSRPSQVTLTVGLSNVGRVNIPKVYGQFELSEISFLASQATLEGCLTATVATFDGKMFLHFPFSMPSISQEKMETVVDSALSCLVNAVKGKNLTLSYFVQGKF